MMRRWGLSIVVSLLTVVCWGQTFSLVQKTDSLYLLTLTTDSMTHQWSLPYPVYRMETGDVDGNGTIEALVGVIKATRFYPEKGRRLFIFKNYEGLVRPMWCYRTSISAMERCAVWRPMPKDNSRWQNTVGTISAWPLNVT